ncbi:MAG: hypothetical protein FD161_1816 [Limisphaerales bacterium]|nr:MAG: hypothetical protein FD161_1816 [Limisphaerales bacterium]TXT47786.1 MAG: hypothetical protein FD140_4059 [Limisphaerales bacterium]
MNPQQLDLLLPAGDGPFVEARFSRRAILHNDCSAFLATFSWAQLTDRHLLQRLQGRLRFRFEGYMDDARGIEQIPELRAFLQNWHRAWPAWFFFADLGEELPRRMTLACLPDLRIVTKAGSPFSQVSYRTADMLEFLRPEWLFLQTLSIKAHLDLAQAAARARAVWTYLGLPPDGFPTHRWPTTLP